MPRTIPNQKQQAASAVEIDAGTFLRTINSGAQSQVTLFEQRVRKMGQEVDANWRLVSLDHNSLVIEDVDHNKYFQANIRRQKGHRIKIENVRELQIIENKKGKNFRRSVLELVDALSEDDTKQAEGILEQIAKQRFRSTVVPENGLVTTRDGITRHVPVRKSIIPENLKRPIIQAVVKALSDNVKVSRGRVVEANFGDRKFEIPITELTRRKVVSRQIKRLAQSAYMAEGFQNRVKHITSLVCRKDDEAMQEAVQIAADLLKEQQEFSLLTLAEVRELVGYALATQGVLNEQLEQDVGLLFYRTNCGINREVILKEWKDTARMTENAQLVENVRKLEESKDLRQFEKDYGLFLKSMLAEDVTTKVAKAKMYLTALKEMRNVLEGGPDEDLVEGIEEYITRLESSGDEVDDATLMEVEELVASTSETLLNDVRNLSDYDRIPEPEQEGEPGFGDEDLGEEEGGAGGGGGPALPFEGAGDVAPAGGDEEAVEEGEGEEGEEEEEEPGLDEGAEELLAADDVNRKGKPLAEGDGKKKERCKECGAIGLINDSGVCNECVKTEGIPESFRKEVAQLDAKQLGLELQAWEKDAAKFFAEDGPRLAAGQLKVYIEHAKTLKSDKLVESFEKILALNVPLDEDGVPEIPEEEPYKYEMPEGVEVDTGYVSEDHKGWKGKMKQSKEGGQIGGKETAQGKGDAAGSAENPGDNLQTMKGGVPPNTLGKGSKSLAEGVILCTECSGEHDMAECMTQEGAVCPECGAGMYDQLMEALAGCGHQMDRVGGEGGGVAATSLGTSDGRKAGGSKEKMDKIGGSGVSGTGLQSSDGRKAGGSKEKMDGQDGSTVPDKGGEAGKVKGLTEGEEVCPRCNRADCPCSKGDPECECIGEVEEDQYKDPTRRRRMAQPVSGRSTINATEGKGQATQPVSEDQTVVMISDKPVDEVVASIAQSMQADLGGGDMEEEPPLDEIPPEGGEEEVPIDDVAAGGEEEVPIDDVAAGGEEFGPEAGGEDIPPEGGEEEVPPEFGGGEEEDEEEEEDEFEEGLDPSKRFKKGGGRVGDDEPSGEEPTTEGEGEEEEEDEPKKPWEESVQTEDNDIGVNKDTEKDARLNPKPKLKKTDPSGREGSAPARSPGKK